MAAIRISLLALCVTLAWVEPAGVQSGAPACNPRLTPKDGALGYQPRGKGDRDRCEGLYERLVALGSLRPVSLVLEERPVPGDAYQLSWTAPAPKARVVLQAVGFKEGQLYRMDTVAQGSSFTWESDVLLKLNLKSGEFGVVATTDARVGGQDNQRVYLPVWLGPPEAPVKRSSRTYVLKMASVEDLSEVYLSISGPIVEGQVPEVYLPDKPLGRSYYSAAAPLEVPLTLPAVDGVYQVRVAGKRKSGNGSTTSTFYVQNGR